MRPCEIGHAPVASGQMRQDSAASRISERSESLVQCSGRIFNHLVNYLAELLQRANILLLQFTEAAATRSSHYVKASLFTTYGILVGSPP